MLFPEHWNEEGDRLLAPIAVSDLPSYSESVLASSGIDPSKGSPALDATCAASPAWDDGFSPTPLLPMDWLRHLGFRHSSTHGRHVGRGLPLEKSSWLNRPFHVDWFAGPLFTSDAVAGRVEQSNDVLGGIRLGWDFDYYWGIEWRVGWSHPDLATENASNLSGKYQVTDVDVIYYPWGDSRVRPYCLWGWGMAVVGSVRENGNGQEAVLFGMPFGGGVQFAQTRNIIWRLEAVDNLAFGSDGVSTQNNLSLTMGMEVRLGARPNSYWPWRAGRSVW